MHDLLDNKAVKALYSAAKELKKYDIFCKDNFLAVLSVQNRDADNQCHDNPVRLASILISLDAANMLTPQNITTLVDHPGLEGVSSALELMAHSYNSLPLTQMNFDIIIKHYHQAKFAFGLMKLANKGILNQYTHDAVKKHADKNPADALTYLYDQCDHLIFTRENIDAVASAVTPCRAVDALAYLYKKKLLTPENRDAVKNHCNPESFAHALNYLDCHHKDAAFFAENSTYIKNHPDPENFYATLDFLYKLEFLTPDNREAVKNHPDASLVNVALNQMHNNHCLTQAFFSRVISSDKLCGEVNLLLSDLPRLRNEPCHPYTEGAIQGMFSKINPDFLTDNAKEVAGYLSRSSGADIATTCKAAAGKARMMQQNYVDVERRRPK